MIQDQITTINIKNDTNIAGVNIPNQKEETRISQYADDSNSFLKNQESVKNVLTFFKNLSKATGVTITLEKTTVLPINTDNIKQIQEIIPPIQLKNNLKLQKF